MLGNRSKDIGKGDNDCKSKEVVKGAQKYHSYNLCPKNFGSIKPETPMYGTKKQSSACSCGKIAKDLTAIASI